MSDDYADLDNFGGMVRLFPLPNVVLFPFVMLPLHIFEPRYRQMTGDALATDRLIAMALLQPGWEPDYEGEPAVYPVACLGRIIAEQRLQNGRYNILLRGIRRIRIRQEVHNGRLYRGAEVELLEDSGAPAGKTGRTLRRRLTKQVPAWFPAPVAGLEQLQKLLQTDLPLGALCDIVSFALPLTIEAKQRLLEQTDVQERVRWLLHYLETNEPPPVPSAAQRVFPPEFSRN
jgi:Lon protease-like protein